MGKRSVHFENGIATIEGLGAFIPYDRYQQEMAKVGNGVLAHRVKTLTDERDELARDKTSLEYELRAFKESESALAAQVERLCKGINTVLAAGEWYPGALEIDDPERNGVELKQMLTELVNLTPSQCLAEIKAQAVDNLCPLKFASIAFRHSDEWPKDIEVDDIKLAFKFMAENIRQQAKAGE